MCYTVIHVDKQTQYFYVIYYMMDMCMYVYFFYIRMIMMIMIIKHPWYFFMISRTRSVIPLYGESFHIPRNTIPETKSKSAWKSMVGRWIFLSGLPIFRGKLLVSGMVFWVYIPCTEARLVTPQCLRWDSGDEWHKIEEDTFRLRRRGKGNKTPVEFVTLPRNGFVVVPRKVTKN